MAITGKILKWTDCSPAQFLRRWESLAQGPSTQLYERHPGTEVITRSHLKSLYALWKDRSGLTAADRKELSLLARGLPDLNAFRSLRQPKQNDVLDFYDQLTRTVGRRISLKLFALHAALPRVFPPLSPMRLAAFHVLTETKPFRHKGFTEALLPTYFVYQKFFFDLSVVAAADPSRVDKALLAVGQFLARYGAVTAD